MNTIPKNETNQLITWNVTGSTVHSTSVGTFKQAAGPCSVVFKHYLAINPSYFSFGISGGTATVSIDSHYTGSDGTTGVDAYSYSGSELSSLNPTGVDGILDLTIPSGSCGSNREHQYNIKIYNAADNSVFKELVIQRTNFNLSWATSNISTDIFYTGISMASVTTATLQINTSPNNSPYVTIGNLDDNTRLHYSITYIASSSGYYGTIRIEKTSSTATNPRFAVYNGVGDITNRCVIYCNF